MTRQHGAVYALYQLAASRSTLARAYQPTRPAVVPKRSSCCIFTKAASSQKLSTKLSFTGLRNRFSAASGYDAKTAAAGWATYTASQVWVRTETFFNAGSKLLRVRADRACT